MPSERNFKGKTTMGDVYNVTITVISQTGDCLECHQVGDDWIVKDGKIPGGICFSAFQSMAADLRTLRYGGSFPWRSDPDTAQIACPDAGNPVVFELRRLRNQ